MAKRQTWSLELMSTRSSISGQFSSYSAVTHVAGKAAAVLQLTLLMLQGRDKNRKTKPRKLVNACQYSGVSILRPQPSGQGLQRARAR